MSSSPQRQTNRLAGESSPYLLQHAHNPVDWYPWGEQAFQAARQSGKPIFLSIGYSTCYWCHVMERQCFENQDIAAIMNDLFINIKVDREERPDVDDIYMTAVQAMTGRGGWPMSVFLTPPGVRGADDRGLLPFYTGTYFPPEPSRGMPGFPQVLRQLADAWHHRRDELIHQAERLTEAVRQSIEQRGSDEKLSRQLVQNAFDQLMRLYDREHGGFGTAPKFPQPNHLELFVAVYRHQRDEGAWVPVAHTLDRMARGGIFDQVGGGFHRYAVDGIWLVPHFEKMLYDNAQLVEMYCAAHELKPRAEDAGFYERVIRAVCDYVLREMLDQSGAFWSAQDAEVDAREGGNYLWTAEQVTRCLAVFGDDSLTELALSMYGLDRGTNFQDPHHAEEPPANVLHLPEPLNVVAQERSMAMAELLTAKARIDERLFAERQQRRQPATDDKVLASWNGMMIAALAMAGRTLGEPRYTQAASRAASAVLDHMRDDSGGLLRTMRAGRAKIAAFLEDYAFVAHGLIELHRAESSKNWLDEAQGLMSLADERFSADSGGYYDASANQSDLLVRPRSFHDGAISSGNSQMVHNLLDLFELGCGHHHLDQAVGDLRAFAGTMRQYGAAMSHMHHALLRALLIAPAHVAAAGVIHEHNRPADEDHPLSVSITPVQTDAEDASHTFLLTVEIGDGYHINSNMPTSDYLVPTELLLEDAGGWELTVAYPRGQTEQFDHADEPISVYKDVVELEATLRAVGQVSEQPQPKLVLRYQACTDRVCFEPRRLVMVIRQGDGGLSIA